MSVFILQPTQFMTINNKMIIYTQTASQTTQTSIYTGTFFAPNVCARPRQRDSRFDQQSPQTRPTDENKQPDLSKLIYVIKLQTDDQFLYLCLTFLTLVAQKLRRLSQRCIEPRNS